MKNTKLIDFKNGTNDFYFSKDSVKKNVSTAFDFCKNNFKEIIFGLYLFFITIFSTRFLNPLFMALVASILIFAVPKLNRKINAISFTPKELSKKQSIKIFLTFFFISAVFLFLLFLAFRPGAFCPDSIEQFMQAKINTYSDWHPVLHTLIFFKIPLFIRDSATSITIFQFTLFAILMAYTSMVFARYASLKFAIFSYIFIMLNPFTLRIIVFAWKDVAFAIFSAFCMLFAMQIYFSNGKWAENKLRIVIFSIFIVFATLFRHNAILFTLPLVFALFFIMKKRQFIMLCILCISLFVFIKGPIYSALNVSKPGGRVLESVGLPLSIICNVAKNAPEKLDEETKQFVKELTKSDVSLLENYKVSEGYNCIKWAGADNSVVDKAGFIKMARMMLKTIISSPFYAFYGFLGVTQCVWDIAYLCDVGYFIIHNDFGITYNNNELLKNFFNNYKTSVSYSLLKYFTSIGSMLVVILAFVLLRGKFCRGAEINRILLSLPILCYCFGTMLLLTGNVVRFFYVITLIAPIIVVLFCTKTNVNKNSN